MKRWMLAGAALCALSGVARAQGDTTTLRLGLSLQNEPRVGQPAPGLKLPYATSAGAGPVDQPFDLSRELGHVVVLVFYPGDTSAVSIEEWRMIRDRRAEFDGPGVVFAGISRDSIPAQVRFSRDLDLWCKLLSDPDLTVTRRFGADHDTGGGRLVVVVGQDGIIRYVDAAFAALDPASYGHLAAAIRNASKEQP
jgi:peroxiredoxin